MSPQRKGSSGPERRPSHRAAEGFLINSLNTEVDKYYTFKENTFL